MYNLEKFQNQQQDEATNLKKDFLKYVNISTDRQTILSEKQKVDHDTLIELISHLTKWKNGIQGIQHDVRRLAAEVSSFSHMFMDIITNYVHLSLSVQEIHIHFKTFLDGVTALHQGILTPSLVNPADLNSILKQFQREVKADPRGTHFCITMPVFTIIITWQDTHIRKQLFL